MKHVRELRGVIVVLEMEREPAQKKQEPVRHKPAPTKFEPVEVDSESELPAKPPSPAAIK